MPYIGNPIYQSAFVTDQFSGTGSATAFTMSVAPAGVSNVLVAVSGVLQDPSTYGVSGTTLTFSTAPPSGTGNISCRYLGVPASGVTTTAYRTVTEFTATASQTTFTPPSYTVGFINVYLNGVLLGSADYTATNGTTVVLATGASAGNLVTVESFLVNSVLNAIPNTAGAVSSSNIQTSPTLTTPTLTSPIITGSTPQVTVYTSGSGTYTTPTNCRYLTIELVGGGAGGSASSNGAAGGAGGNTTFGSLTGTGGTSNTPTVGGLGGAASGGDVNIAGGSASGSYQAYTTSGASYTGGSSGGSSFFGGAGRGGAPGGSAGSAAATNSGSGGGGGAQNTTAYAGTGGGAGGYVRKLINSPSATYSYAVGAAGTGGTAGATDSFAGGAGGAGIIIVTAFF
jgi:hypothetical protein